MLSALMAALTAASAFVRIPTGLVPVTLQTFFVLLAGGMLGSRYGGLSQVVYLMLGLIGLPVFAGGVSGPAAILSPTFGYLLGFPLAAWIVGRCAARRERVGYGYLFASTVAGLAAIYVLGVLHLFLHLNWIAGTSMSLWKVMGIGVLPFVPFDLLKCALSTWIVIRIQDRMRFMRARSPATPEN